MQPFHYAPGRYIPQPGNPPYIWDSLLKMRTGTFITYQQASDRAWELNRFSTGVYA